MKKKSNSDHTVKRPHKSPPKTPPKSLSKTKTGHGSKHNQNVKQVFPVLKRNSIIKQSPKPNAKTAQPKPAQRKPSPGNSPVPKPHKSDHNPAHSKQNSPAQPRKFASILDIKQIISKSRVSAPDVLVDRQSPKPKLKNRGVVTKEVYPVAVSENNKRSFIDALRAWKTPPVEVKAVLEPGPSKLSSKKERLSPARSLKLKLRKQLWNWSKHTLKGNENFGKLFEENAIDVDKINIDKLDLSLINVDALPIENKLMKRTVEWLLK